MRVITIISLCLFNLTTIVAQKTITGTVSDYTNPLSFATVILEGTTTGVLTDSQGRFSLEAHKGDILTVSFVGYETQHFVVNNDNKISIELANDSLDEVVVISSNKTTQTHTRGCGTHRTNVTYGCSISVKGIDIKSEENNFKSNTTPIYPNPSSTGYFNLNLAKSYDAVYISVISLTGQVILAKSYQQPNQNINIDLSRVATGIYIVNTTADGKIISTQKVIKT